MDCPPRPSAPADAEAKHKARKPRTCTGIAWNKRVERWWAYRPLPNGGRASLGYHREKADAEAAVALDREKRRPAEEVEPEPVESVGRARARAFVASLDRQFGEGEIWG